MAAFSVMAAFNGPVQVNTAKYFFTMNCDKVISSNTRVKNIFAASGTEEGRRVELHCNPIMTYNYSVKTLNFCACGYSTATTLRRLNYLLGYAWDHKILPFNINIVGFSKPKLYVDDNAYPFYDSEIYYIRNVFSLSKHNPTAELHGKDVGVLYKYQNKLVKHVVDNHVTFIDILEGI